MIENKNPVGYYLSIQGNKEYKIYITFLAITVIMTIIILIEAYEKYGGTSFNQTVEFII